MNLTFLLEAGRLTRDTPQLHTYELRCLQKYIHLCGSAACRYYFGAELPLTAGFSLASAEPVRRIHE